MSFPRIGSDLTDEDWVEAVVLCLLTADGVMAGSVAYARATVSCRCSSRRLSPNAAAREILDDIAVNEVIPPP